jgi:flagellar protein FliS
MSFAMAQYKTASVDTASPVRLVVQLYDGAIRFMRAGQQAIVEGDVKRRGDTLGRAHAIIAELQSTLDPSSAPELCGELDRLYEYVSHQITSAHLQADSAALEPAISVMTELRGAWDELARRQTAP